MTITIYKNETARNVFVEDNNGAQFLDTLQAVIDDPADTTFNIRNKAEDNLLFANVGISQVVDQNGVPYGSTLTEVVNALNNGVFNVGSVSGDAPIITSATTLSLTAGEALNYELVATGGVGYEWGGLPAGLAVYADNARKLLGGTNLAEGTYTFTATATNMAGSDTQTITLNVSAPPYSNTRCIHFENQDWLGANAGALASTLGRTGNGSGASDAWTISAWFKPSTSNQGQVILYFGDNDTTNGGFIQLMQINSSGNKLLRLRYGSHNNNVRIQTGAGSLTPGTWQHLLITYDGGTTGASSSDMDDYYGRFKIYIDGSLQSTNNSHSNYGWTGGIDADNFRVGRQSGNYMRGCRVDEMSIWGSDQSGNLSDIYNAGSPHDLTQLTTPPAHWWRMGDGDTYPNLQDSVGVAHFVMYNMTALDNIISGDVP